MKNQFVPKELASKLKEKGFDYPCLALYMPSDDIVMTSGGVVHFKSEHTFYKEWAAILYQQAIEWFRNTHGIEIAANVNFYNKSPKLGYYYGIDKFDKNGVHDGKDYDDDQIELIGDRMGFDTANEALTEAILKAIELI